MGAKKGSLETHYAVYARRITDFSLLTTVFVNYSGIGISGIAGALFLC
jgi:hypothetical protein